MGSFLSIKKALDDNLIVFVNKKGIKRYDSDIQRKLKQQGVLFPEYEEPKRNYHAEQNFEPFDGLTRNDDDWEQDEMDNYMDQ